MSFKPRTFSIRKLSGSIVVPEPLTDGGPSLARGASDYPFGAIRKISSQPRSVDLVDIKCMSRMAA
jgi:hypothetical protein